jgi:hypothetical protein
MLNMMVSMPGFVFANVMASRNEHVPVPVAAQADDVSLAVVTTAFAAIIAAELTSKRATTSKGV